jgi:hypothetical protein
MIFRIEAVQSCCGFLRLILKIMSILSIGFVL